MARAQAPAFFSLVEYIDAKLFIPCVLCGEPTQIRCVRYRGAKKFPELPYCLDHANSTRMYFLRCGSNVVVVDKPVMAPGAEFARR